MAVFNQSVFVDYNVPLQDGIGVAQIEVPAGKLWKVQSIFCPAVPGGARVILTYTAPDWAYVSFLRVVEVPGTQGSSVVLSAGVGLSTDVVTPSGITVQLPDIRITEGMYAQLKLFRADPDPNPLRVDFSIEE